MAEQFIPKGEQTKRFDVSYPWAEKAEDLPTTAQKVPEQTHFDNELKTSPLVHGNAGDRLQGLVPPPSNGNAQEAWEPVSSRRSLSWKIRNAYQDQGREISDGTEQSRLKRHLDDLYS